MYNLNIGNAKRNDGEGSQELETVEKPNILDIEPVTIDHPKTATKLSKPTKHPKTIYKSKTLNYKIKFYAESKAFIAMLQLALIKKHILLTNVHKVMKLKL